MPKVSVIIPVYNVEQYIERCARSLFEQTLDDIEYIFIDDCSPDKSIEILLSVLLDYPQRKSQVIIKKMDKNSGLPTVRKWGILHATGDYIIHCDSDDWVDVNAYKELYDFAVSNAFDMVWSDFYRSNGSEHQVVSQCAKPDKLEMIRKYLGSRLMGSVWNRICNRNLYLQNDFVFPEHNMTEDLVITLQLTYNSSKIGYYNKPLYYYFYNENSICTATNVDKVMNNYNGICANSAIIFSLLDKYGLKNLLQEEIIYKKCYNREVLIPLLNHKEYRDLWINSNPEINNYILKNPYISFKTKFRAFCFMHHLSFLYLFIIKFFK